jgi:hypothetical protein
VPVKKTSADTCNKVRSSSSHFTPGFYFLHCLRCEVCVGCALMPAAEGVGTVFRLLVNRWPMAPTIVVYDNACNLARYAMRREASFFKNTKFYIDRFHAKTHHNCGRMFSMDYHPNLTGVNTQVAEQFHSQLAKRVNIQHMNQFTALWHVRSVIYTLNQRKAGKKKTKTSSSTL